MNISKINRSLFLLFLPIIFFSSCKEDKIDTFNGDTNIYFSLQRWLPRAADTYSVYLPIEDSVYYKDWNNILVSKDTLIASLALDGTDKGIHMALIPVSISGNVTDFDRPIKYTLGKNTTGVEGVHYDIKKAIIPANSNTGAIAVGLNRANMQDTAFVIDFELEPNEYFHTNYTTIERSKTDTTKVSLLKFSLYASSFLEKPASWMLNYLGPFSREKVYLILELTKGNINELYKKSPDLNTIIAWGKILKKHLIEQEKLNKTVYEKNGEKMVAGKNV